MRGVRPKILRGISRIWSINKNLGFDDGLKIRLFSEKGSVSAVCPFSDLKKTEFYVLVYVFADFELKNIIQKFEAKFGRDVAIIEFDFLGFMTNSSIESIEIRLFVLP